MNKYIRSGLTAFAILAVFVVSFAAGRMTAVKSSEEKTKAMKEEAERTAAIIPLLNATENPLPDEITVAGRVNDREEEEKVVHSVPEEEAESYEEPPFPLLRPVDGETALEYSLQSVYSETMKDWRAHTGMDIEAPLTTEVKAAADGQISKCYEDKLWGNIIEITHKGGLKTVYKGVSTLSMVSIGKEVAKGDVISGVGTVPSESKAMPHLHFEVWQDGVCINPSSYVID